MLETICRACHSAVHQSLNTKHRLTDLINLPCPVGPAELSVVRTGQWQHQHWTFRVIRGNVRSLLWCWWYLFNTKFCLSRISSRLSITHLSNIGWWLCSQCPSENYWSVISDLHTLSRIFTLSDSSNWSPNTHHRVGHYISLMEFWCQHTLERWDGGRRERNSFREITFYSFNFFLEQMKQVLAPLKWPVSNL